MNRLRVVPIVEGYGEERAVRILITRLWYELLDGEHLEVLKPIRWPKPELVKPIQLQRAVELAARRLADNPSDVRSLVLILVDADDDLPCELAPRILDQARASHRHLDISCVVANVEYETWFVAAARSLRHYLDLSMREDEIPQDPESSRSAKAWIKSRYCGTKYRETVDQPAMTQAMDLSECRRRSPSFDKLCRELEKRR